MELEWLEMLALALAPVVFLFTYVYLSDEYEREPLGHLVITFFLGVLIAFPVMYVGPLLESLTGTFWHSDSLLNLAIYAFVVVATTEELMKYLVLRWYNYRQEEFDEPYDGIMYGVAVSLGFAAIENILYVFQAEEAFEIGMLRMFTAVPAHAMFGAIMGYFVGKAKFVENDKNPMLLRLTGLLAAILFHGLYDFLLFQGVSWLAIFAFVTLLVGIILANRAMSLHVAISPHKEDQTPELIPPEMHDPNNDV